MRLLLGQNFNEFLEIGYAPAREKFQQFVVAVPGLWSVDDVIPLRPRDTAYCTQFRDEGSVRVESIHQMNSVH